MPQRLPRFNPEVRVKDAEQLARIIREVDKAPADAKPVNGAGGGDLRRMRGFPIVGIRGAGGTSPGTDPVRALIAKEGQRRRS
jgi:hypothetical protein